MNGLQSQQSMQKELDRVPRTFPRVDFYYLCVFMQCAGGFVIHLGHLVVLLLLEDD